MYRGSDTLAPPSPPTSTRNWILCHPLLLPQPRIRCNIHHRHLHRYMHNFWQLLGFVGGAFYSWRGQYLPNLDRIFGRAEHQSVIHQARVHFQVGAKLIRAWFHRQSVSSHCFPFWKVFYGWGLIVSDAAKQWEMDCEDCVSSASHNTFTKGQQTFVRVVIIIYIGFSN